MFRQIFSRAGLLMAVIVAVASLAGCNGMKVEQGPLVEDKGHSPK